MKTTNFQGKPKRIIKRGGLYTLRRLLLYFSYRRNIRGFKVAMLLPSKRDKQEIFTKIENALALIERFAPHRIERIRSQVEWVWVFNTGPKQAEWYGNLGACILNPTFARSKRATPEQIASSIMHEATHARVQLAGITYKENLRLRIERLCVRSEIWLARRLPNGGILAGTTESKLLSDRHCTDETFWTHEAFQDRNVAALKKMGRKNWIIRLLAISAEKRVAKYRAKKQVGQ